MKKTCRKCGKKFIKRDRYFEHMEAHGLDPYHELLLFHGQSLERPQSIAERSVKRIRELSRKTKLPSPLPLERS